jgi:hypothetical protein
MRHKCYLKHRPLCKNADKFEADETKALKMNEHNLPE